MPAEHKELTSTTEIQGMTASDYLFCEDCKTWVDFYKYRNLKDTGHAGHNVRNPRTYEELEACVNDCAETIDRCDEEGCDQRGSIVDSPEGRKYHEGHKMIKESCLTEEFLAGPYKHKPLG